MDPSPERFWPGSRFGPPNDRGKAGALVSYLHKSVRRSGLNPTTQLPENTDELLKATRWLISTGFYAKALDYLVYSALPEEVGYHAGIHGSVFEAAFAARNEGKAALAKNDRDGYLDALATILTLLATVPRSRITPALISVSLHWILTPEDRSSFPAPPSLDSLLQAAMDLHHSLAPIKLDSKEFRISSSPSRKAGIASLGLASDTIASAFAARSTSALLLPFLDLVCRPEFGLVSNPSANPDLPQLRVTLWQSFRDQLAVPIPDTSNSAFTRTRPAYVIDKHAGGERSYEFGFGAVLSDDGSHVVWSNAPPDQAPFYVPFSIRDNNADTYELEMLDILVRFRYERETGAVGSSKTAQRRHVFRTRLYPTASALASSSTASKGKGGKSPRKRKSPSSKSNPSASQSSITSFLAGGNPGPGPQEVIDLTDDDSPSPSPKKQALLSGSGSSSSSTVATARMIEPLPGFVAIAQKLTGRGKCAVHVGAERVVKGPYPDASAIKFRRNVEGHSVFTSLAHACGRTASTTLEGTPVSIENGLYVQWRNVGDMGRMETTTGTSKLGNYSALATRSSFVARLSELPPSDLSDEILGPALNHMYLRFILGVGDSHFANLLIGADGNVYGIDIEEKRSFSRLPSSPTPIDLLFDRRPKATLVPVIIAGLHLIDPLPGAIDTMVIGGAAQSACLWSTLDDVNARIQLFAQSIARTTFP